MDTDTAKIDERLGVIERDVAVIKSNYATRDDLYAMKEELRSQVHGVEKMLLQEMNRQTWRFITFMSVLSTALVSATYFIATHAPA